ncbi:AIF_collapsed_G0032020.mRNA.1.CDS.1 [Saccharomyces cerevisiae]|nr:AIF_collapsed_G0032020.mRNA.1.CDS.1 [Saccharomyces cerevisiae]
MFIAQFYVALFPVGRFPSAEGFFEAYLSFPLVMVMYIGHKIYKRNWKLFIPAEKMDIDTGRREVDLDLLEKRNCRRKGNYGHKAKMV